MKKILFSALLLGSSLLQAQDKAALKDISTVFEEIEKNHELWPHHSYTGENLEGGYAYENHVWQAEDDSGLIRIETLNFDDHGQSKTQYFIRGDELLFVLDRTESTPMLPKAATTVEEKRCYFAGAKLIRLLTKEGKFPVGKATDTTAIPNKTVPLAEVEGGDDFYTNYSQTAQSIMAKVAALDADGDSPASADASGTSGDGWRLIQGSRSHDETYALAWGVKGLASPTGANKDEDGSLSLEPEAEGLTNYVVNLRTGAVLGKTAGSHFGDKPVLNHNSHEAAWSAADTFVAQVCLGKWASMDAHVYHRIDENTLSPATDLTAPATKAAYKQLKGSVYLKSFTADDFAITIHDVRFVRQGYGEVMQVGVTGQIPKSEEEHSVFECTVSFTVAEGENGGAPVLTWKSTELHPEE